MISYAIFMLMVIIFGVLAPIIVVLTHKYTDEIDKICVKIYEYFEKKFKRA